MNKLPYWLKGIIHFYVGGFIAVVTAIPLAILRLFGVKFNMGKWLDDHLPLP